MSEDQQSSPRISPHEHTRQILAALGHEVPLILAQSDLALGSGDALIRIERLLLDHRHGLLHILAVGVLLGRVFVDLSEQQVVSQPSERCAIVEGVEASLARFGALLKVLRTRGGSSARLIISRERYRNAP